MDSPSKKKETVEDIDRISTLPESILVKILLLIPTKECVKTSVLSTRWKSIYASVPVLTFRQYSNHSHSNRAFVNFVTNVLNAVTQNLQHISKLSVFSSCGKACIRNSDVTSWVETAVANHVEVISMHFFKLGRKGARMNFPGLFTSGTLVSLSLDLCLRLSVPDLVFLPKLKEIWMKNVDLKGESDDESVRRFFSGCPVLETLTCCFWNLGNSKVFEVSVPSLKSLSVLFSERVESTLLINCPKLEVLDYESCGMGGYSGDVFEYLKECNIEFDFSFDQMRDVRVREGKVIDLVKQVFKTRSLTLAGDAMEALLNSPRPLPIFENMTHLKLGSLKAEGWRFLPEILTSSPRLESLVFPMGFFAYDIEDYEGVPFLQPGDVPTCLSHYLKLIRIDKFLGEEDEYTLVEYFLTNALVLEKMKICPWSREDSEEEDEGEAELEAGGDDEQKFKEDLERHFEITKRLLSFQRSSEVCQIVLLEPDEW